MKSAGPGILAEMAQSPYARLPGVLDPAAVRGSRNRPLMLDLQVLQIRQPKISRSGFYRGCLRGGA